MRFTPAGLFWPLTPAEAHARAATIFIDEFNAGALKGSPNCPDYFKRNLPPGPFKINYSGKP
jgi:hypothetical protein